MDLLKLFITLLDKYPALEKNYYKRSGLLIGNIFLLFVLAYVYPPLGQIIPDTIYRLLILSLIPIIWTITWWFLRNYFPKTSSEKIGIIISINAENEKQKTRIKVDLAGKLNEMLNQHDHSSLFEVIVLNDFQASRAISILNNYTKKRAEVRELIEQNNLNIKKSPKEFLLWDELKIKIKGHFYVWGNIIERQDEENKYFMNLDGLVVHRPVDIETIDSLQKEFLSIFQREISFQEKFEMRGFKFAANNIYLAARYMTGIAAFISGDPETALKLHDRLKDEMNVLAKPLPPNLEYISKKLDEMVLSEKAFLANHYYFFRNNIKKAKELLKECISKSNSQYDALLLSSYITFKEDKNPIDSLKLLHRAKKIARNDFSWLYNKAFLLMYLGKFERAVKDYKKLSNLSYPREKNFVNECIEFNESLVKVEPDKLQSLFIIGFLYFRKKLNFPMALDYFEKFKTQANGEQNYKYLLEVCSSYIQEIKLELKLSSHEDTD